MRINPLAELRATPQGALRAARRNASDAGMRRALVRSKTAHALDAGHVDPVLSEKMLPIPELNDAIQRARLLYDPPPIRDKVSTNCPRPQAALQCRVLPLPTDIDEEVRIVVKRVGEIGHGLELPKIAPADQEIMRIVTIFRELRDGQTLDGRVKLKSPSGSLSTAEAIAVTIGAWAEAGHFGSGTIDAQNMAANLVGAIVKDPVQDKVVLQEYLETVVRERQSWGDLYGAIREVM
jgi:hypothetical protein